MARNSNSDSNDDSGSDMHYFRSKIHALEVVVGDPDPTKGEVAHPTVGFVPYWEEARGVEGRFKVGYLATNNGSAIKKLENDVNVEQIDKEQYDAATEEVFDDSGTQIGGLRAPY